MPVITLKQIKTLKTKKGRDDSGLFIIEGEKFVSEIPNEWKVKAYVISEEFSTANASYADSLRSRAPVVVVPSRRFDSLSDTVTPQGIMAVCEKREFTLDDMLVSAPFLLIGECLADPGNIGTLIRTAAAAGASGAILSAGSGDIYNPKTVRATAGALLRLPVIEKADLNEILPALKARGVMILAACVDDNESILPYDLDLRRGCGMLIGNESKGLSAEGKSMADALVKLPMAEEIESLNASVAGAVLIYEVVRQRGI